MQHPKAYCSNLYLTHHSMGCDHNYLLDSHLRTKKSSLDVFAKVSNNYSPDKNLRDLNNRALPERVSVDLLIRPNRKVYRHGSYIYSDPYLYSAACTYIPYEQRMEHSYFPNES